MAYAGQWAVLYLRAPTLGWADLRREYRVTPGDVDAAEFVILLAGLTVESRLYTHLSARAPSATVETMPAVPATSEQYLAGLGRHRGRVVVVERGQ